MAMPDWQDYVDESDAVVESDELPRRGIVVGVMVILAAIFILMGVSYTAIEITKPSAVREVEYVRANGVTAEEARAARDLAEASKLSAEAGLYQGASTMATAKGIVDLFFSAAIVICLVYGALRLGIIKIGRRW